MQIDKTTAIIAVIAWVAMLIFSYFNPAPEITLEDFCGGALVGVIVHILIKRQ